MRSKRIMLIMIAAASILAGCAGKNQQENTAAAPTSAETQAAASTNISINTETKKQNKETKAAESEKAGISAEAGKAAGKIIEPLPAAFDMEHLDGNTIHVSFGADDVYMDGGSLVTHLTIYDQELYDMVELSQMEVGDTLRIDGQDMVITSLEQNEYGSYIINGGIENDGCCLVTNENGVYYEQLFDDAGSYYKVGEATLPIDQEFTFNDHSDLDNPEQVLLAGDFLQEIPGTDRYFPENAATARIEDGWIKEITVNYIP